MLRNWGFWLIVSQFSLVFCNQKGSFKERLDFTPLPKNNLLASFNFEIKSDTVNWYDTSSTYSHYTVFPKSLGPILEDTKTRELHLRFSQGWWDSELWGSLPQNGSQSGGTGVEVWAVIEADNKTEAEGEWIHLVNSLSGLFCASLNFIDNVITTNPVYSLQPTSNFINELPTEGDLFLFRSALPREPVCTENLTPFLDLLPSKGKNGLSSLLNGHKVYDSQWNSMSIDVETNCDDELNCHYDLKQNIHMIVNTKRVLSKLRDPLPVPTPGNELRCDRTKKHDAYYCFPLVDSTDIKIDMREIFGNIINGENTVTTEKSRVCAHTVPEVWKVLAKVNDYDSVFAYSEVQEPCYEISGTDTLNIELKTDRSDITLPLKEPPLVVSRSLTGYSQDSGGLRIDFRNPSDSEEVNFVYYQSTPWYMKTYLHTLKMTLTNNTSGESFVIPITDRSIVSYLPEFYYEPMIDRVRPSHLELKLVLPPNFSMRLAYKFDKLMLKYAEYPPDANHGFEIEPAIVTVVDKFNKVIYEARTTPALLTLPTPDFSMPYNVIILTSTVMALAFGGIFNLIVKRVVTEEQAEYYYQQNSPKLRLRRLIARISAKFQKKKAD
ncbi:Glycosyl phosphatidyl inositol transamidase complex subunit [Komagataella phaffii CBS 7435]|uniref:Transmembrane protein subunit of the glycosylphosphatidylinositol transamidase complex n=2 Tax=Komagataella phaffii TaxID=460519 RepID=C4R0L5_KOMPG|nr:Transmembrane protein subunit of the glycosylphosphatidylinositol transamidase complex [Komagataella phaffii GS115]AOA61921.1 GQ67_00459T0 [Komagataella phaffii]CAH2448442.1 Glycosyl phosphatidyl inositol transamidase complex subunit [Komagataella phaffii CBS 7435]AOA67427.1 GQ68_00930T0 [Komagataella phaffii GS115]CAY69039.1 Transmembrane protein subunit of the glycosylphosphatidylinositol transamidase complex [Komagataella phaffii GS115]CCA38563.1 Glycosyl phosphatidyl inositol transamida